VSAQVRRDAALEVLKATAMMLYKCKGDTEAVADDLVRQALVYAEAQDEVNKWRARRGYPHE